MPRGAGFLGYTGLGVSITIDRKNDPMDLENFHQKLLGKDQERTPKNFKLSKPQRELYGSFEAGKRGFLLKTSGTRQDPERFLATFVTAFHMTTFPSPAPVVFVVTKASEEWALEQLKGIARHIYRERKDASQEAIAIIDAALNRMEIGTRALQLGVEPERWVSYGFTSQDIRPPWMRGRLLSK